MCYTVDLEDDVFPTKRPVSLEDEDAVVDPKDDNRFVVARAGEHLMVQFQCDLCHFWNIQRCSPGPGSVRDRLLLRCMCDYVLSWLAEVLSHLAFATNGNRSGIENVLGDLPNISHFLYFNIYQPVHYLEQVVAFPVNCQLLGRWLGPLHNVGQALCYWIMKPNGEVISRLTVSDIALDVRPASDIAAMDKQIADKFGPNTKVILEEDEQDEEGHYHDRNENGREDRKVDPPLARDLLVGAQVKLSLHLLPRSMGSRQLTKSLAVSERLMVS